MLFKKFIYETADESGITDGRPGFGQSIVARLKYESDLSLFL